MNDSKSGAMQPFAGAPLTGLFSASSQYPVWRAARWLIIFLIGALLIALFISIKVLNCSYLASYASQARGMEAVTAR